MPGMLVVAQMHRTEAVETVAEEGDVNVVHAVTKVFEQQGIRRINDSALFFAVHGHFHQRAYIAGGFQGDVVALCLQVIGHVAAVEGKLLISECIKVQLFGQCGDGFSCSRHIHTEVAEDVAPFRVGCRTDGPCDNKGVDSFVDYGKCNGFDVLVNIPACDVIGNFFTVEYNFCFFGIFKSKQCTFVCDVAVDCKTQGNGVAEFFFFEYPRRVF